jgi:DNA-binding Xre family transcriptional regulator
MPRDTRKPANPHHGSSLEDFLTEEGILESSTNLAVKRVIAWQLRQAMAEHGITKTEMAARMETSRRQIDRVLNPEDDNVTLQTLDRAARAIGHTLRLELA